VAARGRAARTGERRAAAAGEAGRGPRKKSAARRDKDAGKLRAKWVGQRCQVAVAAAGGDGVRLARVLACAGVFVLQLRRLRAAREAAAMDAGRRI